MVRQIQQHGVQSIEIDATRVLTGVEVTRFVLGSDEAAVEPDPLATSFGQQLEHLRQTVEETATDFVPAAPLDNLVPRRDMLSRRQSAAVWIKCWKHTTTLSLWNAPAKTESAENARDDSCGNNEAPH